MSLKNVLNSLKDSGIVVPKLNKYLLTVGEDEGRNHGWNSPSGVSSCPRSLFYTRKGYQKDGVIDARLRRIFDNGHHVHERLQTYLKEEGCLLQDETPVWDSDLQIIGHCDGIIRVNKFTLAIIELKSINSNAFSHLTTAKPEHQMQAQVYMYCLEKLREKIQECSTQAAFNKLVRKLLKEYKDLLSTFVEGGHKYSKEEKIKFQLDIMKQTLEILWESPRRIDTMSVVYENKDNQELKEFVIKWDDSLVDSIKEKYTKMNEFVSNNQLPDRPEDATKASFSCKYCDYNFQCWK